MPDEQLRYATDELRGEAKVWDDQAVAMGQIAASAESLDLTRLEAGMFQLIVSPYNSVVQQVTARCREGQQAMSDIAETLVLVARDVDTAEGESASSFSDTGN